MNSCIIEVGEKEYTLCLNRNAIKEMEKLGFSIRVFAEMPMTQMEILWYGGFLTNHKNLNRNTVVNLMDKYKEEGGDVTEVIEFLAQEYSNFVNAPTDTKPAKKAKIVKA